MLTVHQVNIPSTKERLLPLWLTWIVQYCPKLMFVISFWIASAAELHVLPRCQGES